MCTLETCGQGHREFVSNALVVGLENGGNEKSGGLTIVDCLFGENLSFIFIFGMARGDCVQKEL